jgi:DNA-binding IclR family transcriptional regulator
VLYHARPGEVRHLTRALMGHMILSTLERQEAERLVARINAEQRKVDRRVKFQSLVPTLDRIRQDGYGYSEDTVPGSANLALLLKAPHNEYLVIGNVGTTDLIRPRKEQILNIMIASMAKYLRP